MAICAAPMFVSAFIMVFLGKAAAPPVSMSYCARMIDCTPHRLVPSTTAVRKGSSSAPDSTMACSAATMAHWAKTSVPSRTRSLIQSGSSTSPTTEPQARTPSSRPGSPSSPITGRASINPS